MKERKKGRKRRKERLSSSLQTSYFPILSGQIISHSNSSGIKAFNNLHMYTRVCVVLSELHNLISFMPSGICKSSQTVSHFAVNLVSLPVV